MSMETRLGSGDSFVNIYEVVTENYIIERHEEKNGVPGISRGLCQPASVTHPISQPPGLAGLRRCRQMKKGLSNRSLY